MLHLNGLLIQPQRDYRNIYNFNPVPRVANDANFMTAVGVSTFTSQWSGNSHDYINYCFHSVAGYQKVGSYTGNGSPTLIDTGFEPAFLMIKRTDGNGTWIILDNKRNTSNPRNSFLQPNTADAEVNYGNNATFRVDFFTNGFSTDTTNTDINDGSYIYLAIAADKDSSVPTQANSFSPTIYTGNGGNRINIFTLLLLLILHGLKSRDWNTP